MQTQGLTPQHQVMTVKTSHRLSRQLTIFVVAAVDLLVAGARAPREQSGDLELDALFEDHGVCWWWSLRTC